jgi:hypothetical protein
MEHKIPVKQYVSHDLLVYTFEHAIDIYHEQKRTLVGGASFNYTCKENRQSIIFSYMEDGSKSIGAVIILMES